MAESTDATASGSPVQIGQLSADQIDEAGVIVAQAFLDEGGCRGIDGVRAADLVEPFVDAIIDGMPVECQAFAHAD